MEHRVHIMASMCEYYGQSYYKKVTWTKCVPLTTKPNGNVLRSVQSSSVRLDKSVTVLFRFVQSGVCRPVTYIHCEGVKSGRGGTERASEDLRVTGSYGR